MDARRLEVGASSSPSCCDAQRGGPNSKHTRSLARRLRDFADAGVTTLSLALFVADADSGKETLRTVAEAYAESGLGE